MSAVVFQTSSRVDLFTTDLSTLRATELGPFGYAVLDMLLSTAETGQAPMQIHGKGAESYLAMTMLVGEQASPAGYLFAKMKPDALMTAFKQHCLNRVFSALINTMAVPSQPYSAILRRPAQSERLVWLSVPTTLFRVGFIQGTVTSASLGILRPCSSFWVSIPGFGLDVETASAHVETGVEGRPC